MAVVETKGLTKVFKKGELGAVNDVNLTTKEGEFLVFLGPSGSGKTTLLRMIAGLETPTSGQILFGIEKLLHRKPRELSGGERQRVALARAIVREPTVFLLDEPLSNLDAKLRTSAREELEQFHARVKTTTIYVTHDQVEAMALGDRVVVLHQGVVRQIGTPKEVYDDPADTFVATFLGSPAMNLIPQENDIVGFRPEHLLPASLISPDQRVSMHFHFSHEEYLGAERILYGSLSDKRFEAKDVISRLPSRVEASFAPGSIVEFAVPRNELKFFDRATEKRAAPRVISWQ